MRRKTRSDAGYSLAEALVVIGIIGLVSVVSVPAFLTMQRSAKVKAAIRQFANDARGARQAAVTSYRPVMVSLGTTSEEKYSYWIYMWDGTDWVGACVTRQSIAPCTNNQRQLENETALANKSVYFTSIGFPDVSGTPGSNRRDIIFENNGALRSPPVSPTLRIRTDFNVGKPEFRITVYPSGSLKVD